MSTEDSESLETVVAAFMGPDGRDALTESAAEAMHLKSMWERLRFGTVDKIDFVGLPLGNKVNADTLENHSRHLHSLLHLLNVPITESHNDIVTLEIAVDGLEPIDLPEDD